MKASTFTSIFILAALLGWSTSGMAGCTKQQLSGSWAVFFADGNFCKLKFNAKGILVPAGSACVDPDRGTTEPDAGFIDIESGGECVAVGVLTVEGVDVNLHLQFSTDRSNGAGVYQVPIAGTKGSLSLVRVH